MGKGKGKNWDGQVLSLWIVGGGRVRELKDSIWSDDDYRIAVGGLEKEARRWRENCDGWFGKEFVVKDQDGNELEGV